MHVFVCHPHPGNSIYFLSVDLLVIQNVRASFCFTVIFLGETIKPNAQKRHLLLWLSSNWLRRDVFCRLYGGKAVSAAEKVNESFKPVWSF